MSISILMAFSVYLDKKPAFENISKEEAEHKQMILQQMIRAGVPSSYTEEQVKVIELKAAKND